MRSTTFKFQRSSLRGTAAACFLALAASCHTHDDGNTAAGGTNAGSNGAFVFSGNDSLLQRGEFFDCIAALPTGGTAEIQSWTISQGPEGASLANIGGDDAVRFVAGPPGFYLIEAVDNDGQVGTYGFDVANDPVSMMVTDVVQGSDLEAVAASLATSGTEDLFIAERIGGSSAPQVLARANRAGDRVLSRSDLTYKIQDMAADASGNLTVIRTESTLTAALVRLDRDLEAVTTFSAPDLGGPQWRNIVAMTRAGESLVPVDINGGSILRLDADGAPAGGTVAQSLLSLGLPFADVIDMATDVDGAVYVASATEISRIATDGSVDTTYWSPTAQVEIRALATDIDGVLFVALQDADGGQCGSIRKLDWTGTEFRRIMEFSDGTEFAARKILDPVSLGVFPDGAWRLYDDIVTLNPNFERAAWILSGDPNFAQ